MSRPLRNRRVSTSIAAICALALVPLAPLRAAADDKDDEPSKTDKLLTQVTALTTAIEGVRSKGGDTVATGGGQLEGALLSSFAIKAAANKIRTDNPKGDFLVASSSDAISTDRWLLFDAQYKGICFRLTGDTKCGNPTEISLENEGTGGAGPVAAVAALLPFLSSLFRSDTEVSALGGELSDSRLLARAIADDSTIAAQINSDGKTSLDSSKFRLLAPKRLSNVAGSEPYTMLEKLIATRTMVAKANAATKKKKPDEAVAASVKVADEFIASVLTADTAGHVPLLDIIRGNEMQAQLGESDLLTVSIEKAGGTMLKRKGIDVALGAPSVRASGGVIVSYTVEAAAGREGAAKNADAGKIIKTGFLACTTRLTELKRIHRLKATDFTGNCS